ncbi:MAG: hypothetical protein LIO93_06445 [Bacteroidales bacterium]|nr:hypothetical protein [Bacteroidales bacterium]
MKRCFLIFVTLIFMSPIYSQYSTQWKEVESFEKQSLPKSALEVVDQIYQDALKNNNSAELIKSIIYQLKFETSIDKNKLPEMIREIKSFTEKSRNKTEQAVLYSVLANVYKLYYDNYSYSIRRRTAITGFVPEDIREWPANLFIQKISDLVDLSVLPAKELQNTPASEYEKILIEGETSRSLRPTLYDFLVHEGIGILSALNSDYLIQSFFEQSPLTDQRYFAPVNEFIQLSIPQQEYNFSTKILSLFQQLLQFRNQDPNHPALLIADLDRLDFVKDNYQGESLSLLYLNALEDLKNKYNSSDYVVEVLFREASYYTIPRNSNDEESQKENLHKAYEILKKGIDQYPHYERIGLLKNLLTQITQSNLTATAKDVVYPGQDLCLQLNYKNLTRIHVEIYKIDAPIASYKDYWDRTGKYKKEGKLVKKETIDLTNNYPYISSDTTIKLPMEDLGNYEYVIKVDKSTAYPANKQFSVSRLASISRSINNQREFLVTDRMSGTPIEGAQVRLYKRKSNNTLELYKTVVTDVMGLATENGEKDIAFYNIVAGDDKDLTISPVPWISNYNNNREQNAIAVTLFTDRSIYRPGQTVYFKGISYQKQNNRTAVLPNKTYNVSFRDANNKEISNKSMTTNEFGSFAGEFVIPQGLLTGRYTIRTDADNGSIPIRVEEYKRPTFDIKFDENDKTYNLGDSIHVTGSTKTFSGVNLQEIPVKYKITRKNHWLYRGPFYSSVQIAQGEVQTDTNGNFKISFTAEKSFDDRNNPNVFYTYTIEATVTSTNGETQTSNTYLSIGEKSMYLSLDGLQDIVDKNNIPDIKINSLNLNNKKVDTSGTFEIYRLDIKNKDKWEDDPENWTVNRSVLSGNFTSGETLDKGKIANLPSGRYRIIAKAKDLQNREIETQQDFTLASTKDKQPPVPTYKWVMTPKINCLPGEKAEIILGSSVKEVYVLYEIFKDNKKLSASRFVLNNENRKIEIPYLESYGEGITVTFTYVKDEKFFTENIEVRRKQEDKSLNLTMAVFRDRLLPGQQEEWKISVKDTENNQVLAEVLAGMYDASLDKIYTHSWRFNPVRVSSLWSVSNSVGSEFNTSTSWLNNGKKYITVPDFEYDSFNWFGFGPGMDQLLYGYATGGSGNLSSRKNSMVQEEGIEIADLEDSQAYISVVEVVVTQKKTVRDGSFTIPESSTESEMKESGSEVQIRQNFNETAFFYPQLKTNEAGETILSFTVPESNTTWKFMALAHTKDLKFGQLVKEAISQKKLMVAPNVPRFIRTGDRMTLSANISNLSEESISGSVYIEFLDPSNNQPQIEVKDVSKTFAVEPGKTTSVNWSFEVPSGIDLTTFKIVAQSATFSDGEQHLIPVLPNRIMVTESMPLNVTGNQQKEYTFEKLANPSPSLENYRLTLEFASNPTWYAVQALPSITTPQNENVLSWFGAYYSNVMATNIANSTPKIKQIIDAWTKQGENKETLLSNLEKNQDLKNVLLEETPWVMEAEDETSQQQRLSLLFDLNRAANLNNQALDKLKALQAFDGGWSWFKNMNSDVSITQWILYGMGELSQWNGNKNPDNIAGMRNSAIGFIDNAFIRHYEDLKKNNKDWKKLKTVSTYELEYLFVRSYYKNIDPIGTGEAVEFYSNLLKNYWANSTRLYDRALAAIVLQRNGNTAIAKNILKSLSEHATHDPELGMYWANNNTYSFMTQSATCVHTFIMQAFKEVGATAQEMDEMKLWLLKQKQTQMWESVPATVASINILLNTGSDWLSNTGNVEIKLGKQTIDSKDAVAGTGYIKKTYDASSIQKNMANVKVNKSDNGPAWGALYWQYFEDLDKINDAKTDLNVQKEIYKEQTTANGKTLVPVSENSPLKVGDKVTIRLTIRTNRDMEFVHLKDMRASCFELTEQLSGNQWSQGLIYYQAPKDASMNFYFHAMPKGTYVLEYNLYASASGNYSNGIATIQCLYAPEYISHTPGGRVNVE